MRIAYLALKVFALKAKAFEKSTKNPITVQEKLLLGYLHKNRSTEYGRKYHFSEVRSIPDYQKLVPMSDSESIFPYVESISSGARNVLTKDKVVFFGLTSGTTGKPKLIPVTNFSRAKKAEMLGLWTYYIMRDHPDILDGKILAIINPEEEAFTKTGIPCGAESGHAYKNMPAIVRNFYAIPYDVFHIPDYESRYYCILRIAMGQNITTIATLNPSTIALLCQKIEKYKDILIDDIKRGALYKNLDIPLEIRKSIERGLRANPGRAGELESILQGKKTLLPKDFWPNLKLIECWKGGTVKIYLKELPQYFGDIPVRDFGCFSTEARASIPMSEDGAGGVLAVGANFYEFIPKEDMVKRQKRFLLCNELEKDREYFIIVTTPGGLYRYNIDDIVKVTGFFNNTPVIEFVQKGLNAVSIMGEKLYESQLNEAVNRAVDKNKLLLEFFSAFAQHTHAGSACARHSDGCALPACAQGPRYVFLVEFDGPVSSQCRKDLLRSIEEELGRENAEYKYARDAQLLKPPILKVIKKGEFERYRARRVMEGANDSQLKVPELTSDENFQKNFIIEEEIGLD
ncbi:MAG: GH3 auxin-responsive promoter family protein [Candidatus Omnitrophota bacterium]|nr:GH3 auxin-responsive promoter family protein [Candidatus Omnitrophota bacterium]